MKILQAVADMLKSSILLMLAPGAGSGQGVRSPLTTYSTKRFNILFELYTTLTNEIYDRYLRPCLPHNPLTLSL